MHMVIVLMAIMVSTKHQVTMIPIDTGLNMVLMETTMDLDCIRATEDMDTRDTTLMTKN